MSFTCSAKLDEPVAKTAASQWTPRSALYSPSARRSSIIVRRMLWFLGSLSQQFLIALKSAMIEASRFL